ncbi:hypothetical protein MRX96_036091 [Rhipicephalus microplus]
MTRVYFVSMYITKLRFPDAQLTAPEGNASGRRQRFLPRTFDCATFDLDAAPLAGRIRTTVRRRPGGSTSDSEIRETSSKHLHARMTPPAQVEEGRRPLRWPS